MRWKRWARAVASWLLAVGCAAVLGTLVQTQFNLQALIELGLAIPLPVRVTTTWRDLIGFTPAYAAIVAGGFVVAIPIATWLLRRWPKQRWLLPAAGAAAILTALWLMQRLLQLTAIAAARDSWAVLALALAGAAGGWLYLRLRVPPSTRS
ncbi:MAG: hypothetical protein AB7E72_00815 [Lysobacterales bacterium]